MLVITQVFILLWLS